MTFSNIEPEKMMTTLYANLQKQCGIKKAIWIRKNVYSVVIKSNVL